MKIVALSGGVGGAKMVQGLAQCLPPLDLTVIVNTGDDFEAYGLHICPDLDTVCYTLAGLSNDTTGWGQKGESWNALKSAAVLGGPTWFNLGDRDLGTHLERTRRLAMGQSLSEITHDFCTRWGVEVPILPMSDQGAATMVDTIELGEISFQEYFVKHQCQPAVRSFRFEGIENARPAPGVISAIQSADYIILTPSNPWVSVAPILAVEGVQSALQAKKVVAVSPIIAGKAIKGPAAKMYREMGIEPGALAVASHYRGLISALFIDNQDADEAPAIDKLGIQPVVTNILIPTPEERKRLASEVLAFLACLSEEARP
jgi:LPPG:FO 2-phospho-L-lactate transferase